MVGQYDYLVLYEEFVSSRSSAALKRLLEWFEQFGAQYWNGEYYDADEFKIYLDCTAQLK